MLEEIKRRPLRLGELFNFSFYVFRKNFLYILAISLFVYVPYNIIIELFPQYFLLSPQELLTQDMNSSLLPMAMLLCVNATFVPLAMAGYTAICKLMAEETPVSLPAIMDHSLQKWYRLVFTFLLMNVLILLSAPLLVLPAYLAVIFAFYTCIVAVTDEWGLRALLLSRKLVHGRWWRTAGMSVLTSLLSTLLNIGLGLAFSTSIGTQPIGLMLAIAYRVIVLTVLSYFHIIFILYFFNIFYLTKTNKSTAVPS